MMTLIVAAALAAQPANAPAAPPAQHQPMMQMGDHPEGQQAAKQGCCCHDMMAKMHEGKGEHEDHSSGHSEHSGR